MSPFHWIAASTLALMALGFLYLYWNRIAEMRLGPVKVELTPSAPRLGQELSCRVTFTPAQDVALNEITVELLCHRHKTNKDSKGRTYVRTEQLFRGLYMLHEGRIAAGAGEPQALDGWLRIPGNAPPSTARSLTHTFWRGAVTTTHTWELTLRLDVDDWADWSASFTLPVLDALPEPDEPDEPGSAPPGSDVRTAGTVTVSLGEEQTCPFCRDGLGEAPHELLTCGACRTVFHRACMAELRTCTTTGCRNNRRTRSPSGEA